MQHFMDDTPPQNLHTNNQNTINNDEMLTKGYVHPNLLPLTLPMLSHIAPQKHLTADY
jgi:hypothetical protein